MLNAGEVSRLVLAQVGLAKLKVAAEQQENLLPSTLGYAMFRPGTEYIAETQGNLRAFLLSFVRSAGSTGLIEISNNVLRVFVNGALVTRPAVTSAVTNGNFNSNVTNWTDADEAGGTSAWETGGYMKLTGSGTAYARMHQQVTVPGGSVGVEHALRIIIERGPVGFRVGTTATNDDYIGETLLGTGEHSLAFTPTGDFFIVFQSADAVPRLVNSVQVEASGVMALAAPWALADIRNIRADQSADVLFLACDGYQQRKIERRGDGSWSLVLYAPIDGPFGLPSLDNITMDPSSTTGSCPGGRRWCRPVP